MPDEQRDDVVHALHRAAIMPGSRLDLHMLSPEQAATVLVDTFVRTACVEALVGDPQAVRKLVRRDCRRRRLTVKTMSAGATVAVIDEVRHNQWLQTEDGQEYERQRDAAVLDAIETAFPPVPERNWLRPVD